MEVIGRMVCQVSTIWEVRSSPRSISHRMAEERISQVKIRMSGCQVNMGSISEDGQRTSTRSGSLAGSE